MILSEEPADEAGPFQYSVTQADVVSYICAGVIGDCQG